MSTILTQSGVIARLLLLTAGLMANQTCGAETGTGLGTNTPAILATIKELRSLSSSEAATERPIKLQAVVTFHSKARGALFVHDGTDGTFVRLIGTNNPTVPYVAGTLLEIEGVSAAGKFASSIAGRGWTSAQVKVLGSAPIPEPLHLSADECMDPIQDQRFVEVEGIVREVAFDAGRAWLEVDIGNWRVKGFLSEGEAAATPWHLVEVPARIRGVVASLFNDDRQMTGRILYIASPADILPKPMPVGRNAAPPPLRTTSDLLRPDSQNALRPTRVRGVVTRHLPGLGIYLRGEEASMWVQTAQPLHLPAGTAIEALGSPVVAPFRPFLRATSVTTLDQKPAPKPLEVSVQQAFTGKYHAELITLEAEFLEMRRVPQETWLQLRDGGLIFQAKLGRANGQKVEALAPGSVLRLTGICLLRTRSPSLTPQVADEIEILLESSNDVTVLQAPAWWTTGRLVTALSLVLAVAAAALLLVVILRRRVESQAGVIVEQRERDVIQRERLRIAQDLHDDLGAAVTHIGLLSGRALDQARSPEELRGNLQRIGQDAVDLVRRLDTTVWAINPKNDTLPELISYLCRLSQEMCAIAGMRCRLDIQPDLPNVGLSAEARHHLAMAVKEAFSNAVQHAQADELLLTALVDAGTLVLGIRDTGKGFETSTTPPGDGLDNMSRRLAALDGTMEITNQPGGGTTVTFRAPLHNGTIEVTETVARKTQI